MDNSSPKLISAALSDHEALGVGGDPIYRAAEQIRTLLHKELGESVSQVFAVPVRNDKTNQIDWYSSVNGDILSFNQLSPEQQSSVKTKITECFSQIDTFRDRLRNEIGTDAAKTYASLLDSAKSFPSDDQIFVIDGKPVITFWGFKESLLSKADGSKAQLGIPVLPPLTGSGVGSETINTNGANASLIQPAEPKKSVWQRYGWWLVLAILLLLGIPAILKSCSTDFPLYKPKVDNANCPVVSETTSPPKAECAPDVAVVPPVEKVPVPPEPEVVPLPPPPPPQVLSQKALEQNDLSVFEGKWVLTSELHVIGTGEKVIIDFDMGKGGNGSARLYNKSDGVCSGAATVSIKGSKNFIVKQGRLNCSARKSFWDPDTYNCSVRPNLTQADCSLTCSRETGETYTCASVFEKRK
jgi:hypothetical protein